MGLFFRIYVDLPDAANRLKILKIILARENLESEFPYENLANATEGYSGSDLKVTDYHVKLLYAGMFLICVLFITKFVCSGIIYRTCALRQLIDLFKRY